MQLMNGLDKASPERSRLPPAGDVVVVIVVGATKACR